MLRCALTVLHNIFEILPHKYSEKFTDHRSLENLLIFNSKSIGIRFSDIICASNFFIVEDSCLVQVFYPKFSIAMVLLNKLKIENQSPE